MSSGRFKKLAYPVRQGMFFAFTLIELLVVIAIIAILAGHNQSRDRFGEERRELLLAGWQFQQSGFSLGLGTVPSPGLETASVNSNPLINKSSGSKTSTTNKDLK
ncbi:MAG: prepilin-type N-terminal cleavage/methylation domain-containing protein [Verrucomicrobia bacterium]|nr:prepilin-type N-terminal cleavage/methylation domain-containing protein [Verrucomicrobiota bacterium]